MALSQNLQAGETGVRSGIGASTDRLLNVTARALLVGTALALHAHAAAAQSWRAEWPRTDFSKSIVPLHEIRSGGPPRDGIPSIDVPKFERLVRSRAQGWSASIGDNEPVISLSVGSDARAYPLRLLIWHEIANDTIGGTPVAVTYCPLCNAALVFDRRVDDRTLDFGTTGKLRNSDLVMYDRQTESWWQQFTGEAIVGSLAGRRLGLLPSRLESFGRFRNRFPDGSVLVPSNPAARNYGRNPYVGYDASGKRPFLYDGSLPADIDPMERVVAVETAPGRHEAWSLALLAEKRTIRSGAIVLEWQPGQASALDRSVIGSGRDVGNVVVWSKQGPDLVEVPYDVTFAFAFHAFRPQAVIHKNAPEGAE
jgi:Protein of unknown function (DUF3179)